MQFKLTIVNGKTLVADANTGEILDWVHVIDVDLGLEPCSRPILYLGTLNFSLDVTAGAFPPPPPSSPQS